MYPNGELRDAVTQWRSYSAQKSSIKSSMICAFRSSSLKNEVFGYMLITNITFITDSIEKKTINSTTKLNFRRSLDQNCQRGIHSTDNGVLYRKSLKELNFFRSKFNWNYVLNSFLIFLTTNLFVRPAKHQSLRYYPLVCI